MFSAVASLRAEPAVPDPPVRVWRDWVLVGIAMFVAVLEAMLREDVPSRWPSLVSALVIIPMLLWRGTNPLAVTIAAFATAGALSVGHALVVSDGRAPGLYTLVVMIILPYTLARWASGRDVVIGTVLAASFAVLTSIVEWTGFSDLIGGLVILALAEAVGLAVRFKRRDRELELERVRATEREHVARDLHDTVAHHVSAITIRAQAGLAMSAKDPGAAIDALRVIEAEASRTLAEMRAMVGLLRRDDPAALAPSPELVDLHRLADAAVPGPSVEVELQGDLADVPPAVASAVYRLAQESITNARRHARGASRIDVHAAVDDEFVRLEVRDDGQPASPRAADGYGVQGMIERAGLLGGRCEAGPGPDGGWVVTAAIPLHAQVSA